MKRRCRLRRITVILISLIIVLVLAITSIMITKDNNKDIDEAVGAATGESSAEVKTHDAESH